MYPYPSNAFHALIIPMPSTGTGQPPGIWGGAPIPWPGYPLPPELGIWPSPGHPAHPIAPGGPPPVAGWTPPGYQPSHPIAGTGLRPEHPIAPGGPPPGIWPSPGHPSHPIFYPPGIWGGGAEGFPTPPIVIPPPDWQPPGGTEPPEAGEPPVAVGGEQPIQPIKVPEYILVHYPGYGWIAVAPPAEAPSAPEATKS
jgi:hypothetical protein